MLSKSNFDENSIIIETFTLKHGKCAGIIYGGSSKKNKKIFQLGNKILLNYNSKNENRMGYFSSELIEAVSPMFFDSKMKSICMLSAVSILKILLPERQINKVIYNSFEELLNKLNLENLIKFYIFWELSLIKELGFDVDLPNLNGNLTNSVKINDKTFLIPKVILNQSKKFVSKEDVKKALMFNKNILIENFFFPNKLRMPLSRNILEKYFS